jgi:hypothetical protein
MLCHFSFWELLSSDKRNVLNVCVMAEQCKVSRGQLLKVHLCLRIAAGIAYSVSDTLRAGRARV